MKPPGRREGFLSSISRESRESHVRLLGELHQEGAISSFLISLILYLLHCIIHEFVRLNIEIERD